MSAFSDPVAEHGSDKTLRPGQGFRTGDPEPGYRADCPIDAGGMDSHKRAMQDEMVRHREPVAARRHEPTCGVILTEGYAGLEAQAIGLAERAGIAAERRVLAASRPWRWIPARIWPAPLGTVGGLADLPDGLVLTVGGTGAAIGAALRRQGRRVVQIQNPRMRLDRFDLVVANHHDEIRGPNVLLSRTALHRVTPAVLADARRTWTPRLAHLPRPLVAVLVGGSNGRFRLGPAEAEALAQGLASLHRNHRVGLAVTPSRRTGNPARAILDRHLFPLGAFVWDMTGDNPYLGLLACADSIVVTADSVSMVSEAVATAAPVAVVRLPGRSRRIELFLDALVDAGRVCMFDATLRHETATPLDDTAMVAAELCRRLGLPDPSHP